MASGTPVAEPTRAAAESSPRHAWIDNLRVAVIVGVIGAHVSLIYALDVGWYYQERTASTVAKAILAAVFSPGLLFGMGLMFFVAGLFTPPALAAKGTRRFVVDRLRRLGLPVLVYVLVLNPAMNYFGDQAMDQGEDIGDYVRTSYWHDVEFGVAWFVAALLLFSLSYAGWRRRHPAPVGVTPPLGRRHVVRAVLFIAVASFAVRLAWPFLGTGELAGANVWEYPQMAALFVLGVLAAERDWLADGLSPDLRRLCGRAAAMSWLAVVLIAVVITLMDDVDPFLGGFHVEATLIPLVEATIAVCMSLWATDWFHRRWDRTTALAHEAGRASFAAYLFHAPLTILLAALLRDIGIPAEVKFLVVFAAAVAMSFALGSVVARPHPGGRIL